MKNISKFIFLTGIVLLSFVKVNASDKTQSLALAAYVEELRGDCPVDFGGGWMAQSYDLTSEGVNITVIADFPQSYFDGLSAKGDAVKTQFLADVKKLGPQWSRLIRLTAAASQPLIIDIISATGASTIEIVCTAEELAAAM